MTSRNNRFDVQTDISFLQKQYGSVFDVSEENSASKRF